ncbi:hypothetical protein WAI89_20975, partial [Acinetobacter baumannii]
AVRLYGPAIFGKSKVVGEEISVQEFPADLADEILSTELNNAPFVLYLGRRSATKNVPVLLKAFESFKRMYPRSDLKLVLVGPGHPP